MTVTPVLGMHSTLRTNSLYSLSYLPSNPIAERLRDASPRATYFLNEHPVPQVGLNGANITELNAPILYLRAFN